MAKRSRHLRLFVNVAHHRFGDAEHLRQVKRTVAAAYLAGYAVECYLKALILSLYPEHRQQSIVNQFRGSRAHDFLWLKKQYFDAGGSAIPQPISFAFVTLASWNTELRYNPRVTYEGDIDAFFESIFAVRDWALKRI